MKAILLLMSLIWMSPVAAAEVEGFWSGVATRGGETRPMSLNVERKDGALAAHYNIPSLSLEGMPLAKFAVEPEAGLITSRAFNGRIESDRITGELYPALLHGPSVKVDLRRSGAPPQLKVKQTPVQFSSRGHVLKGWLVTPQFAGPHPALVSLHGSGPSTRWLALARARRFAEAGYAMLIFDKPGSGESQGDWTMTSLDEMAQDAIAAVNFLRARPDILPDKVGLWGHSQAGWVISRAAAMPNNNVGFAIVLAGGGASSREVEDYGYLGRLQHARASASARAQAMAWVRDYFNYVRDGTGYEALTARLRAAVGEEWAKALAIDTVYPLPEQQPKWRWVATYDPASDIRRMRMPVLLLFAELDESSPSERSLAKWREALAAAGNRAVEWKMFANADHHFLTPAHTDDWPTLAPGYYEMQIAWLKRVVG